MAYLSLYRKWRPQRFADVTGQEHVVKTLENSLRSGRIAHAYLFTGPRGTGKTTVARLLAKGLNCKSGPTADPCGECDACQSIATGQSLNVIEIDGASNRGIEEVRDLREQVRYAPSDAKYKVYIIDEVHMLTTEAFNALLKTLEEPPEHVIFMFATTDPHKIPATILSRCQRYDFKRFTSQQIIQRLNTVLDGEGVQSDPDALALIADHAEGGMRDALGLVDQCIAYSQTLNVDVVTEVLGIVGQRQVVEFVDLLVERNSNQALQVIQQLYDAGKDLPQFTRDILKQLRKLLLERTGDRHDIFALIEGFAGCERELRYASDVKIPLELTILKLTDLPSEWENLTKKISELEGQIQKLAEQGVRVNVEGASSGQHSEPSVGMRLRVTDDEVARLEKIRDHWSDYLLALREERLVQPEAFLREGEPVLLQGEDLVVAFPKERGFHKASIEQEKHRQPAERVLGKFFGMGLKIKAVSGTAQDYLPEATLESGGADVKVETRGDSPMGTNEDSHSPNVSDASKENEEGLSEPTEQGQLDETVMAALKMFGGKVVKVKED